MRWFNSLQSRLLLGTTVATTGVFIAAGVLLYVMVGRQLRAEMLTSLRDQVQAISSMFEQTADGRLDLGLDQWRNKPFHRGHTGTYFEVYAANGRVLAKSKALGHADILPKPPRFEHLTSRNVALPGDVDGLAVGLTLTPPSDRSDHTAHPATSPSPAQNRQVTLVIAHGVEHIEDALAKLGLWLLVIWFVAIVVEVTVLAWVVRRGLRPGKLLADQVAQIDGDNLSQRIRLDQAPTELVPIVGRLNDLLNRVETAFAHEKAFLGHVAHELRTPLAGLRSTLEVALSKQREADDYRRDLAQSLAISHDMQVVVDNLLTLARMDAGQSSSQPEAVPVHELLDECWSLYAQRAQDKNLGVEWQVGPTAAAWIDRHRLRIVLRNLIDNAVTYCEHGGQLQLAVARRDEHIIIDIANDHCPIPASQADRVFDRFWRGDPARRGDGGHCGLGLALCKQIVEQSEGSIVAQCQRGGMFKITCRLPAGPTPSPEAAGQPHRRAN